MATYKEQFYLYETNRLKRPWKVVMRDLRLLRYLTRMVWRWYVSGGPLRRELRQRQAAGEVLWVDPYEGVGKH